MIVVLSAMLCMGFASIIGGATGFGTALIATPLMLLAGIDVTEIVVVNLIVGLVTRIAVSFRLRAQIDWHRVALLGCASLPGAWLGVLTVNMLPGQYLKPAAGVLTVLCGLAMAPPSSPNPQTSFSRGEYCSRCGRWLLQHYSSLNGPPVVLLLSRAKLPPMSFIGDLAGYFVITNTLSLALLWAYTDVQPIAIWPMIVGCIVIALLGNAFGMWIARRLPVKAFQVLRYRSGRSSRRAHHRVCVGVLWPDSYGRRNIRTSVAGSSTSWPTSRRGRGTWCAAHLLG